MPWREVYLRLVGIWQSEAPLRRLAMIIHNSLVEKPSDIIRIWPLPLDGKTEQETARERLQEFYWKQKALLEKRLNNGERTRN